ncbi:hypothetical protein SAMN05880590_109107 [Rhizobium sp. RU35A]|nr:hypothetical protein SAMN05880590_109107 [Rhizobium sp. RU35A]
MKNIYSIDDVFGIRRDPPLNYVERPDVDHPFRALMSRGDNIIIFGSSRQGKTSLRKKCMADRDHIVVSCQNRWSLADLHCSILKEAVFFVKHAQDEAQDGGQDEPALPIRPKPGRLDLSDPNDIVRALADINFSSYIVLEDFHYLPDATQREFSFSLKTFHENTAISFVIAAAWRDENRLSTLNGDLTDRVQPINTDHWSTESLSEVMTTGAGMLGIAFDDAFSTGLLAACFDSVHLVQEACRRACRAAKVHERQDGLQGVGAGLDVVELVRRIVTEQAARYTGFVEGFSGAIAASDLDMPRWLIYAMLCHGADQLERGIRLKKIYSIIKARHPRRKTLDRTHVAQTLVSTATLQNQRGIRPFVIDYDASRGSLQVVDRQFLLWLSTQEIPALCDDLGLPAPLSDSEMRALI